MSTVGLVTVLTLVGVAGLLLAFSGAAQQTPRLTRVVQHIQRTEPFQPAGVQGSPDAVKSDPQGAARRQIDDWSHQLAAALARYPGLLGTGHERALVGRTAAAQAGYLAAGVLFGMFSPALVLFVFQLTGVVSLTWYLPILLMIFGGLIGGVVVRSVTTGEANEERQNLRFQLSAYLDVVSMMLAGNSGYEGALEQAASAGDGRLFRELRRRMREVGARGASLTGALTNTADFFGLFELREVASTAALSAAEGSPVAKTLAAKCATMRAKLASEEETEARLRTSRLSSPIFGMALIFMALVFYAALNSAF